MSAFGFKGYFLVLAMAGCLAIGGAQERGREGDAEAGLSPWSPVQGLGRGQGLSFSLGGDASVAARRFEGDLAQCDFVGRLNYVSDYVEAYCQMGMYHDGQYPLHTSYQLGFDPRIDEAWIKLGLGGLSLRGGRGTQRDAVDSPYSLFISSKGSVAPFASLTWKDSIVEYQSTWVQLNTDSSNAYEGDAALDWLDRGLNLKKLSVRLGDLRLGYQDASIYLMDSFDAETFLAPLPVYFLQIIETTAGRPWSESVNSNSLMGFFADYKRAGLYLEGQFLLDDINSSFLAPILGDLIPSLAESDNLTKLAWSLGGRYLCQLGDFGLYHAGATKYTFAATYTRATGTREHYGMGTDSDPLSPDYNLMPYEYCYYPSSIYDGDRVVSYMDNYIGYCYGENAISFLVDYKREVFGDRPYGFGLYSSLEYAVNGSKAPNNPWHEYDSWQQIDAAVEFLNDPVLEHSLILRTELKKRIGGWELKLAGELGYVWNQLSYLPIEGKEDEAGMWTPQEGRNGPLIGISLGATYLFNLKEVK